MNKKYDIKEFEEAAKPLVKWLNDNCNPHVTVIVTPVSAELYSAEMFLPIKEFMKD